MHEILERLLAFDTVSSKPNIALMGYVKGLLEDAGIPVVLVPDAGGGRRTFTPPPALQGVGGVMLSGHTDVVPVEGQALDQAPLRADRSRRAHLRARGGGHEGLCRLCGGGDAARLAPAFAGAAASGAVL